MTDTELVPAIGYIRVSTYREEQISDDIQRAVVEEAARRDGRRIVKWVVDLDATGRNFKRRIMQAITHVEARDAQGAREIWTWKFSRFGRDRHGVALNLARVEQAGGRLVSATEAVDATTAVGKFTRGMLFELAAFESDRAGEQWKETHAHRRTDGLPATGGHRFGYLWTPRIDAEGHPQRERYDIDPDTAPALRDIYRRYADGGEGFLALAKSLNAQGLKNPHRLTKGGWSMQSLGQFMDSGFGAGMLHVHVAADCPDQGNCPTPRDHYGYIKGAHDAILTTELWEAYLARRAKRRAAPPRSRIPKYPFTGIVRCGLCGGAASAYTVDGTPGGGWRCTRHLGGSGACTGTNVTTRRLLREVHAWLAKVEAEIDQRAAGTTVEPKVEKPDTSRQQARLASRLTDLQQALDQASKKNAFGLIPDESYARIRDEIQAEAADIQEQLAVLGVAEEAPAAEWAARQVIVRRLREEWDTLPVVAINDLLGSVLEEVRIWSKGCEPRVLPVPAEGLAV